MIVDGKNLTIPESEIDIRLYQGEHAKDGMGCVQLEFEHYDDAVIFCMELIELFKLTIAE